MPSRKRAKREAEKAFKRNPKLWIVVISLILVIAIAAGAIWYFLVYKKDAGPSTGDDFSSDVGDTHGGTGSGNMNGGSEDPDGDSEDADSGEPSGEKRLVIRFLELGNGNAGDCTLIQYGNTEVLIDAGSKRGSAKTLVPKIKEYCTDGLLEYVIVTHAHEDHIAAFVGDDKEPNGIFVNFKCGIIIDYARQNTTSQLSKDYTTFRDKEVSEDGAVHYTALECWNEENGAKREYSLGENVKFEILYQKFYEQSSSDENNYSVCTLFTQGEEHYLFTGDLEKAGEESLVESNQLPHCKLFKAGHHGSATSSNDVLLKAITPENVCVCCCAGSSEYTDVKENQFPTQAMIDRVAKYTKNIFVTTLSVDGSAKNYTSMNGEITVRTDGVNFSIHGSNNDTVLKDTDWFKANRTWPQDGVV